ncbi:MAG: class I SAM-dependent methyltransferase [Chloroflexi bacterium]|nr:class I SAM-dependent methyltransferase [Chloroflexota bacterium]
MMVITPADEYAARVAAFEDMRLRWRGGAGGDEWSPAIAEQARADPRRVPDANLEALASYIDADDTVLDVGGGAGRIGLALAPRCREVINVDPSAAMRAQFERTAAESGITNARFVESVWPAPDISGDVVLTTHVTYFVRDIVPFVRALEAAARRRVLIGLWSVPPPHMGANVYELVFGGPFESSARPS